MFKAASEISTLLERSPYISDTENSAFFTRFGVPTYGYYDQNPQKGVRFAQSMNAWSHCEFNILIIVLRSPISPK